MSEFIQAVNALSWPGAFAFVGVAASAAYLFKGHPDVPDGVNEDDVRRIVREELARVPSGAMQEEKVKPWTEETK